MMGVANQVMEQTGIGNQQPLVKMAQQASQDESLMAAHIKRFGEKEGLSWSEIARQLQIDSTRLAKLALCRAPRRTHYNQDLKQIASYAGVRHPALLKMLPVNGHKPMMNKRQPFWQQINSGMNGLFKRRAWSFSFAVVFLFILGAVAFAQPKPAQAATLVVLQGRAKVVQNQVLPVSDSGGQQMIAAGRAMTVNAGDEISLGAGASAQLRLFDGSTVDLFENTSLEVTELQTSEDEYRVGLNMLAGKTVSRVIRLLGVGDAFKISTPSSTASVRGTVFTVEVLGPDSSYISCDEGIVWVDMEDQQVEVSAGFEVTATLGQTLDVQSQTEEAPVIVAEAPVETPPVEDPPVDAPPVEAPPVEEAPAATPATVVPDDPDEENPVDDVSMSPVVDVTPAVPPVKAQDKPRPPIVLVDYPVEPTEDDDVDLVSSSTDSDTDEEKVKEGGGPPAAVPGNTPDKETGEGTPPTGGGAPPGQVDNPNANPDNNSGNSGNDNNNSDRNSEKGKPDK